MASSVLRVSRRTVGGWLREKRQRVQLSQSAVARDAGITQGSLSNYETGKREVSIETLLRLSTAVAADLGELVGAEEVILLRGSRLASAATALQREPRLLDQIVPPEAASGEEIIGEGEFVPETGELRWSDDYYRILGWSPGEVVPAAKLFLERVHPDDREDFREYCEQLIAGLSYVRGFDLRLVIPETGEIRRVRTQSRAEYDREGTPLVLRGTISYRPPA